MTNHRHLRIRWRTHALLSLVALGACAPTSPPSVLNGPKADLAADSGQFHAVMLAISVDTTLRSVQVRPAPLPQDPTTSTISIVSTTSGVDRVTAGRSTVLMALGIAIVKTIPNIRCDNLVYDTPRAAPCPTVRATMIAVGLSREGGAYYPGNGTDERAAGIVAGHHVMRVLIRISGPTGLTGLRYDYVLARRDDHWMVIDRVALHGGGM